MTRTKRLSLSFSLALCFSLLAGGSLAYGIDISPSPGIYLDQSDFEFTVVASTPGERIEHIEYFHNSIPVTTWFQRCMTSGYTSDGRHYLSCKGHPGAMFGVGHSQLELRAYLDSGRMVHSNVDYEILATAPQTVSKFTVPAKDPVFATRLFLEPHIQYQIVASGEVSLWPQNSESLLALPGGNGRTCNYSNCYVRGAPAGALVGRLNGGPWFVVGTRMLIEHRHGELFLSVNDHEFKDNLGAFHVEIMELEHH